MNTILLLLIVYSIKIIMKINNEKSTKTLYAGLYFVKFVINIIY